MAKQPTRFRVTPEMVEAAIKGKPTFTKLPSGKKIVCELTLQNGFTVIGVSGVVDLRNHVEKIGREIALANAKDEIWKYLGYTMQSELHEDTKARTNAKRAKAIAATRKKTAAGKDAPTRKPRGMKRATTTE